MNQLAIDFDAPRSRNNDPTTSHAAAARVAEFSAHHFAVIVQALKDFGPMTVSEIAKRTGLGEQQINKRTPELAEAGAIALAGGTRPGASGRQQRVWKAKARD